MKRFLNYFLSMTMIASLLAVTSCGDDTDDVPAPGAPTFEVTGVDAGEEGGTTASVGETVNFTLNVNAPGGFNRLLVEKSVGEDGDRQTFDDVSRTGAATQEFTYEFSYTPTAEEAGQTIYFDFMAVDDDDLDNVYQYVIEVEAQQVTQYNTVLLDAPLQDQSSNVWFSTSTGEEYSTQQVNTTEENVSGEIDFGYRYGPTAGATLASPAQYPTEGGQNIGEWAARNETHLRATTLSADEFLEHGNDAQFLRDIFEDGTAGTNDQRLTGLVEGQVLAFMTDPDKAGGSQYGLIHVENIAEGTGVNDGITLNVRVTQ